MKAILLIIVFAQAIISSIGQSCLNGIHCKTSTQYVLCSISDGEVVELSSAMSCPNGQICDAQNQFGCVTPTTTPTEAPATTTVATSAPTSIPSITTPSPSSCINNILCKTSTAYVLCSIQNGKVVELSSPQSCPAGQVCDASSSFGCVTSSITSTTTASSTTSMETTTVPTETTPPPTTTTTPSPTTSTTTPPTTTNPAPTTVLQCTADGNFAAPQCNQYYRCVYVMWWWDRQLFTCPSGQAFDATSQQCVTASQVNCPV